MAPKTHFDAGEVQQVVNEATAQVFENLKAEGWDFLELTELTCEYLGPLTDDGPRSQRYVAQSDSNGRTVTTARLRV